MPPDFQGTRWARRQVPQSLGVVLVVGAMRVFSIPTGAMAHTAFHELTTQLIFCGVISACYTPSQGANPWES